MSAIVRFGAGAGGGQRVLAPLDAVDGLRRVAARLLGGSLAVPPKHRPPRAAGAPALDHVFLQARGRP